MEAIYQESLRGAPAYGNDATTAAAVEIFRSRFECDCDVYFVGTGTAANVLALSSICPPYGAVLCHQEAHIRNDESTAPEFFTGGARLLSVPGRGGKPALNALEAAYVTATQRGVHSVQPAVLSLTNATELGTVYTPTELAQYARWAHGKGLRLHVDGARFANACASVGASFAEMSWQAGVDLLTLGATKNGAMAAEAIVVFDSVKSDALPFLRKRAGHLWSKYRFLSAQFEAWLADDLWHTLALHANEQAAALARGFEHNGLALLPFPTEANEVFAALPGPVIDLLLERGVQFYRWPGWACNAADLALLADGPLAHYLDCCSKRDNTTPEDPLEHLELVRFVTAFNTEPQTVSELLHAVNAAYEALAP